MCQIRTMRPGSHAWHRPWRGGGLALICLSLGLTACGGDDPENWTATRPRIDEVEFVGQSPRDPLGLQFMLRFVDSDADLGRGRLKLSVSGVPSGEIDLPELFAGQSPPLAQDVAEGEFEVLVRLAQTPDSGQQISIGFVLEDAAGQNSNEPTVTLTVR